MAQIDKKLNEILGKRYITGKSPELKKHFRDDTNLSGLSIALPKTHEEVQDIVKTAHETGTSLFTNYEKYFPEDISKAKGVVIDYKEMTEVERTDKKNLMTHIQPGVSFNGLQKKLKKDGLKMAALAGVTSDSVVLNSVNRATIKSAAKYPEPQVTNMYAILGDGRLHKTGSHALDETASDTPDGAAYLSSWYMGARDTYGIITRGSIVLYPMWEKRNVIAFDFEDINGLLEAMRDVPRREIGIEYLGMDDIYLNKLTGLEGSQWTLAVGFDGFEEHVTWQEKIVREQVQLIGGKENKKISEALLEIIDDIWLVQGAYNTEFITQFNRAADFDKAIGNETADRSFGKEDAGRLLVSLDRGRALTCIYEFYRDDADTGRFVDDLNIKLLAKGAYFDTPQGDLSEAVFKSIEGYSNQLKRIKDLLDPNGILNPGILKY